MLLFLVNLRRGYYKHSKNLSALKLQNVSRKYSKP